MIPLSVVADARCSGTCYPLLRMPVGAGRACCRRRQNKIRCGGCVCCRQIRCGHQSWCLVVKGLVIEVGTSRVFSFSLGVLALFGTSPGTVTGAGRRAPSFPFAHCTTQYCTLLSVARASTSCVFSFSLSTHCTLRTGQFRPLWLQPLGQSSLMK